MGQSVNCFTDISTWEAYTVTQKLDLDQMSERSIHMLKDTKIWLHSLSVASFGFIVLYMLGKWLQKEDIAESAVPHFFLNVGLKSLQLATIPGCWRQRIWGTSFPHICPWNSLKKMEFIFSVINQKSMASCRVLNCGYFCIKSKRTGHVEGELWFFYHF